ncbi:MAG: hypothetical protein CMJ88_11915 [Planctomycetes bacterium]|nr:hypothetical protein [Planctomycetota bacterium]
MVAAGAPSGAPRVAWPVRFRFTRATSRGALDVELVSPRDRAAARVGGRSLQRYARFDLKKPWRAAVTGVASEALRTGGLVGAALRRHEGVPSSGLIG